MTEPGVKHDAGKLRASLVLGDFARALTAVCQVGTFGAQKYSDHGWLSVPGARQRYEDAMMRHWLAHQSGEELDNESGLPHMAHFAWNALALVELSAREAPKFARPDTSTCGVCGKPVHPMYHTCEKCQRDKANAFLSTPVSSLEGLQS